VAWHSAKAVNRRLIGNAAGKLSEFLMTRRTDVVRPRRILARVGMESGSPGRFICIAPMPSGQGDGASISA
jgi:hypothetical protein